MCAMCGKNGLRIRSISSAWMFPFSPVSLRCVRCMRSFANVETLVLVKPQFEAGSACLNKHGIVKDANVLVRVLESVIQEAGSMGYCVRHLTSSSIRGRDGNQEFLMHLTDEQRTITHDLRAIVRNRPSNMK